MNCRSPQRLLARSQGLALLILLVLNQFVLAQGNGYWDTRFAAPYLGGAKEDEFIDGIAITESGEIYVTGVFSINGRYEPLMKWNGSAWESFGRPINGLIDEILAIGDYLYVGGRFTMADSVVSANRIARYNLITKKWSALGEGANNGMNSTVVTMAYSSDDLYAGGTFTIAGGMPANHIAKWNAKKNLWAPLGSGIEGSVNGVVNTIIVNGQDVYVGGTFKSAGGMPVNYIAKWDGEKWSSLGEGVNDLVFALTLVGKDLYVGGKFTQAGGIRVDGIARWDTKSQKWFALDYISGCGGSYVFALASYNDMLFVGGGFCAH